MRRCIIPNAQQAPPHLGRDGEAAVVIAEREEDFPACLTRLGAGKVDYLVRAVAQIQPSDRVLDLFAGTGLTAVLVARRLKRPDKIISVDLHYSAAAKWRFDYEPNYAALAARYKVSLDHRPQFLAADARSLPLEPATFDVVLAADSPRSLGADAGKESNLGVSQQRNLFLEAGREALRVLKLGGVFAGTAPISWIEQFVQANEREIAAFRTLRPDRLPQSVRFQQRPDGVTYFRVNRG